MKSPNPSGRPPGILDKRSRVTKALMEDAPAIARVVIDKALEHGRLEELSDLCDCDATVGGGLMWGAA
ncbi:MAG: hypothetical protein KA533_01400 [Sphingobium sp.]|nr:hypothetical protein [Sphingobium sp.]MBP8669982.1 hypothetical protein [Sphingobium sp.]MBP9158306.1 hypothetical protein [Sphingobium sp.]